MSLFCRSGLLPISHSNWWGHLPACEVGDGSSAQAFRAFSGVETEWQVYELISLLTNASASFQGEPARQRMVGNREAEEPPSETSSLCQQAQRTHLYRQIKRNASWLAVSSKTVEEEERWCTTWIYNLNLNSATF